MLIRICNSQRKFPIDTQEIESVVEKTLQLENIQTDEVTVHFVSKKKITELHDEFFDDPTPTDCISFPIDEADEIGYNVLGEIFVCPEVAREYALQHGNDAQAELKLYVIHGLLHLIGYDDIDPKDRKVMRQKEKAVIDHLFKKLS